MDIQTNVDMLTQAYQKDWHYYEMMEKKQKLIELLEQTDPPDIPEEFIPRMSPNLNGIDTDEPIPFVWRSEHMNKKVDMVEVVRCTNCKWFDTYNVECDKNHSPKPPYRDWFCADGEKNQ